MTVTKTVIKNIQDIIRALDAYKQSSPKTTKRVLTYSTKKPNKTKQALNEIQTELENNLTKLKDLDDKPTPEIKKVLDDIKTQVEAVQNQLPENLSKQARRPCDHAASYIELQCLVKKTPPLIRKAKEKPRRNSKTDALPDEPSVVAPPATESINDAIYGSALIPDAFRHPEFCQTRSAVDLQTRIPVFNGRVKKITYYYEELNDGERYVKPLNTRVNREALRASRIATQKAEKKRSRK